MRLFYSWFFCLAVMEFPATAQIIGLSTNYDGSELYFSATQRLRGSDQPLHPKIFHWTPAGGVELYAQRERLIEPLGTNFYSLIGPSVSADGLQVAFTGKRECERHPSGPNSYCMFYDRLEGVVQDRDGRTVLQTYGAVQLSRNGRYALLQGQANNTGMKPPTSSI